MLTSLTPKQRMSIRESDARINLWDGSVRSGKTFATMIKWAQVLREHDGEGALAMIGKTERTLYRNVLEPMRTIFGSSRVRVKMGAGEARILGKKVQLVGANDERAEGKIRGWTVAKAYGDEVSLWPKSFFNMLLSRCSVYGAQLFLTTNPDGPRHYVKTDIIDRAAALNLKRFHFRLEDNTHLDPAFVEAIKREYVGLWFKRYILGQWVVAEGAIYDMFDDSLAVTPDAPPEGTKWVRTWVGVDYGTTNPFVALLFALAGDGTVWVVDEWTWDSSEKLRQLTDAEYVVELKRWLERSAVAQASPPVYFFCDPSAASFILQAQRDGLPATQAMNEVVDGIRLVSTSLAQRTLRILRKCERLRAGVQGYVWDAKAQARGEDKPLKVDDHECDALRYGHVSMQGAITGVAA